MKAFECMGRWWLPGKEKEHAAGLLKISEQGDLRLWLVGSLEPIDLPFRRNKLHPIILGWVDESQFGDIVTLYGCLLGGSTFGSSETSIRENYHAARAYFGAHLEKLEDFAFKSMSLRLAGLEEWAYSLTEFVDVFKPGKIEETTGVFSYTQKNPLTAKLSNGQLMLGVGIASSQNKRERLFRESVDISIFCDSAKSTDQLSGEYIFPLQNLMTFVCDRPQKVEAFSVRASEFPQNAVTREIRVVGPRVEEEEKEARDPVRDFQMLFTLADVDFSEFIGKWLRVMTKFEAACNVFFGIQYGPPAYLDMIFPNIVQALYLYSIHRKDFVSIRAEEERRLKEILSGLSAADSDWVLDRLEGPLLPPLRLVLHELVEEHSDTMNPLVSSRQDRFVNEVLNTLRYIMFREVDMASQTRHGADLYWMMQKLRFLFKSCILQELEFEPEKMNMLFKRNSLYNHVCEIESTVESTRLQSQP